MMHKAVIDTSSLLYAWHNYPNDQFPTVWEWLAGLIMGGDIIIFEVVKGEIKDKIFNKWLAPYKVHQEPDEIDEKAEEIKASLGIARNEYGGGVKLNDIHIIAFAAINNLDVITNESDQANASDELEKRSYKIPLVCEQENIRSYDFLTLLIESGKVFGTNIDLPPQADIHSSPQAELGI